MYLHNSGVPNNVFPRTCALLYPQSLLKITVKDELPLHL